MCPAGAIFDFETSGQLGQERPSWEGLGAYAAQRKENTTHAYELQQQRMDGHLHKSPAPQAPTEPTCFSCTMYTNHTPVFNSYCFSPDFVPKLISQRKTQLVPNSHDGTELWKGHGLKKSVILSMKGT